MGIILYNGDSFTYGDELNGSRSRDGNDTHHHHTYAYKLSTKLQKKYVNLAQNGSSNMKIFRRTIDYIQNHHEDIDMVVITWSSWGRFELCEPFHLDTDKEINIPQECNMNQIIPSHRLRANMFKWDIGDNTYPERTEILKQYTENVLTMQTQIIHGLMFMKHIQWLCDTLGIPVVQGVIHKDMYSNWLSTIKSDNFPDYKKDTIKTMEHLRDECRIGLGRYIDLFSIAYNMYNVKPMGHADEDSHTYYANMIYEITKEKGWFDVVN